MMRRRAASLLGAVVLAGALTAVPAGAAQAADPLQLSLDGVTWSATLPSALFASPAAVVPGDVITAALWVRNASGDPARVDLGVADDIGVTPGTLAGDLSVSIDGTPTPGGTSWHGPDLAPGASARIPLVVTFAASSQLSSRVSVAAVLDSVTLVQTGVGTGSPPRGDVPTSTPSPSAASPAASSAPVPAAAALPVRPASAWGRGLAHTGADVAGALGVAFAAVGVGFLLLVARRRSRRAQD
jgi:hypothetical protein